MAAVATDYLRLTPDLCSQLRGLREGLRLAKFTPEQQPLELLLDPNSVL